MKVIDSGPNRRRDEPLKPDFEQVEQERYGCTFAAHSPPPEFPWGLLAGLASSPLDQEHPGIVPLIAAHESSLELYAAAGVIFVSLSACASGGYLFNDLLDVPHDSQHKNKRYRPIAAGRLPSRLVVCIAAVLATSGLALAFWFSAGAGLFATIYLLVAGAYSLWLKRSLFLDVIALALLYETRVLAGAATVAITPSAWLLAFSLFFFLALAIVKRQTEMEAGRESDETASAGRPYVVHDLFVLAALSAASGFASVVVLTLYIQSPLVTERYGRPEFLWLLCPLLIYWLGRMTLLANRGAVGDDPLVYALRDRASWAAAIGGATIFAVAL